MSKARGAESALQAEDSVIQSNFPFLGPGLWTVCQAWRRGRGHCHSSVKMRLLVKLTEQPVPTVLTRWKGFSQCLTEAGGRGGRHSRYSS